MSWKAIAIKGVDLIVKYSPQILVGVGIVSGGAALVATNQAAKKFDLVSGHNKRNIRNAKMSLNGRELGKELSKLYVDRTILAAKVYGPAIGFSAVSVTCVLAGFGIMNARYVALASAYKTLDAAFNEYREATRELVGEEAEEKMIHGNLSDDHGPIGSPYKILFCQDTSVEWQSYPAANLMYLRTQQNLLNDRLRANGRMFLNEVYRSLGLPETKAGQIVGWMADGDGDGYIDFGIFDMDSQEKLNFLNGEEPNIWLDFNVDGNVWELM